MEFSQFCVCNPPDRVELKRQIDLCAGQGRSYEFANCRLPPGCRPIQTHVGFWRTGTDYLLYFRPAPAYSGSDPRLRSFFDRGPVQRFASFQAMTDCLQALTDAPSAPFQSSPAPNLFQALHRDLRSHVLGQEQAVEAAAFKLWNHICKREPLRPLSLIFYGPTGVGKSELGKAIAPVLNRCLGQDRYRLVWTELNTFTQPHSVYRLTGAPPGYVGYDDSPILEAVRRCPYTVFMFDELDKAHPEVLKVFMSILDEGRCTAHRADAQGGRELDFRQCVLLFTTNADLTARGGRPVGFSAPEASETAPSPETCEKAAASPAELAKRLFQENESARQAMVRLGILPEIAGRFGGLIPFCALDESARQAVTVKQIQSLGREYGLRITSVDPRLAQALTPGEEALSARSNACVLESLLAPLFSSPTLPRTALRLTGTLSAPQLVPAQLTTLTRPLAASRL